VIFIISEPHITGDMRPISRQTFHSTYELPLMRSWYQECNAPTVDQLNVYLAQLNTSPMRQERGPISFSRLKMWWKNEKQRSDRRAGMVKARHNARTAGALPSLGGDASSADPNADQSEAGMDIKQDCGGSDSSKPRKKRRCRKTRLNPLTGWTEDPSSVTPGFVSFENGNNSSAFDLRNGGAFDLRNDGCGVRNISATDDVKMVGHQSRGLPSRGIIDTAGGGRGGGGESEPLVQSYSGCSNQSTFDMVAASAALGGIYPRIVSSSGPVDVNQHSQAHSLIRWN